MNPGSRPQVFSREVVSADLREWAIGNPPSRFAVYKIYPHRDGGYDGQIVAWGLAAGDHISVQVSALPMRGTFDSVEAMSFLFGPDFEIVWIDREETTA